MIENKCRVCYQDFFEDSLLHYKNMPKSAQFFPDEDELMTEKGMDLDVCQCSGCGLVQLTNSPVFYYKEVIRAASVSKEMRDFRLKQFKQWIKKYELQGKKVIEIGCGAGEYISMMPDNVRAFGLEQGKDSVKQCVEEGFIVEEGFVENEMQKLNHAPFDAFYMLNFLEHLPDPNSTLKGICHNLADDAIGLVEVPNFDMILRNNLFSEFISDHLFYFTQETFISTLNRNGFEVIECNEIWHDYSISAVVKKRKKTDLSSFHQTQQKLTKDIEDYIGTFPENSVAIWGAGHQALAIMSLTGLKGKIKYVVDSAPFKQNKFTPATHILIVSPDEIKETPVKAVIVMAGSYSDEVVSIIRSTYNKKIKIVSLGENGFEIC